jgi:hypothetical protein
VVAAIFEAEMTREQADRLVGLMRENLGQRAPAVLGAMVLYENGKAQLIAVWESEEAWERYRSSVEEPRAAEFMREVGAEPTLRVVPVLEWA